jgi:2-polyprenyl-3-methyl-5-hydroxy-6-metoxy-1,4-benzoquinol methylase
VVVGIRKADATLLKHADLVANVHEVGPRRRLHLAHDLERASASQRVLRRRTAPPSYALVMDEPIADEIRVYYEATTTSRSASSRVSTSSSSSRTREIIERHLPAGRLRMLDVGGGTGVHARWLAELGHSVEVVDPMPRHVAAARALGAAGLPSPRAPAMPAGSRSPTTRSTLC